MVGHYALKPKGSIPVENSLLESFLDLIPRGFVFKHCESSQSRPEVCLYTNSRGRLRFKGIVLDHGSTASAVITLVMELLFQPIWDCQ